MIYKTVLAPLPRDGHAIALSEKGKAFLFGGQSKPQPISTTPCSFGSIRTEYIETRTTLADFHEFDIDSCRWIEREPQGMRPPARRSFSFLTMKTSNSTTKKILRGHDILGIDEEKDDEGKIESNVNIGSEEFIILYGGSGVDPTKVVYSCKDRYLFSFRLRFLPQIAFLRESIVH